MRTIHHPCRTPLAACLLLSLFAASGLRAQDQAPTPMPAPPAVLSAFDVLAGTLQQLDVIAAPNGDLAVPIELGGSAFTLSLVPFDVRAPNFQLIEVDAAGPHLRPRPANVTYRGALLEDPSSWVAATVIDRSVTAIVHRGSGEAWGIQPVGTPQRGQAFQHLVYRQADSAPLPWTCGVQSNLAAPVPPVPSNDLSYVIQIACEADFPYFQLNGSNLVNTQNDVTAVINATSQIYTNDMQISYTITQLIVNTSADPYSSSVAGTLLNQFTANWNNTHGSVQRDVAHLFTGRNMGAASGGAIGIAFVSVVCQLGSAYGVSQSRWTNNFTLRVAVTAHELGHNLSAQHCDAVPPCFIMCSGVGGCNNVQTTFSQNERNQILSYTQSAACIQVIPDPPTLTSISPTTADVYTPGFLNLTGTGFLGTSQVQVGSTTLTSGFTIQSDTSLRVGMSHGPQLGPVQVTTTNISGTSNPQTVTFVPANPCALTIGGAVIGGSQASWSFAGQPNDLWVLLLSSSSSTVPFGSFQLLGTFDILSYGFLDAARGFGNFSVTVPPVVFSLTTIFTQLVDLQLPAFSVQSTSAVRQTTIFG